MQLVGNWKQKLDHWKKSGDLYLSDLLTDKLMASLLVDKLIL